MNRNLATRTRRYFGAALITSLVATLATIGSVTATNPDDLTVTGASESTITLALTDADTAATYGNVSPGGAESGEGVLVQTVAAGSCFDWADTITVSSNVIYDVEWVSNAVNANLDFMTANPTDYTECTGGATMSTTSANAFASQAITASQAHPYWLGLDVKWSDGVDASIGDALITFTATAA